MSEYGKLLFKIRVHPTLWFVIGIAILTAHFVEMMMLLLIVFIHEMGHAVCAQHFKWRIKSIQLLPFGGAVETEEYGNKSLKEDLAVVLAGPLQHVWLIGAAFLLYFFTIIPYELYQPFLYMNLMLLIFNLLPIWPLDGGRLLFIGISLYCTFLEAQKHTLHFSAVFAVLAFLTWIILDPLNLNIWLIIFFISLSLVMEWRQRYYAFIRFLLQRHYGHTNDLAKLKPISVDSQEPIYKVLELFQRGCKHPVIIMKNGKESGSLDETEILHAYFSEKMTNGKIGDLLYSY
ncbi:M50 family metallopeptidase [Peribacillus frigoritolerans]|uniref:M50 family metallopeptidase n=1 Tax=Peribacillus frigoritolerans TaxID=450367 RepID=UPI000BBA127C|nr:M50 family metallopeptidase [Peribacillus frigoritolerans]MBT2606010.1 M50 family metallopeptidase [Bacillus sp. ISL-53]MCP1493916.1 stage IV sporulation protein FB [Peribacillus frigoritolerans]PCD09487.1 stage IV sporulation protein FB [Peribacillus simplex]